VGSGYSMQVEHINSWANLFLKVNIPLRICKYQVIVIGAMKMLTVTQDSLRDLDVTGQFLFQYTLSSY
jgi:hypothetical protein